ncbi:MAG: TrkA family potassium uptake protein [Planctomycetota bacterium]
MNVMVVGGGKLTYFLAKTLLSKGYAVTIVNRTAEERTELARALNATVIHGDGSDPQTLEDAGAGSADAVLAVTPNDQDNLAICQLAELRFGVPRVLALVNDPDNEDVFRQLGIRGAFSTTRILATLIEQKAAFEDVTNLIPVAEGKVNVTEVVLAGDSPVKGKLLKDVPLPENTLVACLLRGGNPIVPRGATVLEEHDRVILLTLPENHGEALRVLTGDTE